MKYIVYMDGKPTKTQFDTLRAATVSRGLTERANPGVKVEIREVSTARKLTNIALDEEIQYRLHVVSAQLKKRPCEIVEQIILDALPELEMQAAASKGARVE
jgi:hypothetical protein